MRSSHKLTGPIFHNLILQNIQIHFYAHSNKLKHLQITINQSNSCVINVTTHISGDRFKMLKFSTVFRTFYFQTFLSFDVISTHYVLKNA